MGAALNTASAAAPETLLRREARHPQQPLALATPGVQRWVWEGRFGAMLIEVVGEQVFVDGQAVQPFTG